MEDSTENDFITQNNNSKTFQSSPGTNTDLINLYNTNDIINQMVLTIISHSLELNNIN